MFVDTVGTGTGRGNAPTYPTNVWEDTRMGWLLSSLGVGNFSARDRRGTAAMCVGAWVCGCVGCAGWGPGSEGMYACVGVRERLHCAAG